MIDQEIFRNCKYEFVYPKARVMRKLTLLFLISSVCEIAIAQIPVKNMGADTTITKDSAIIEEMKESMTDNLPVISLDDNDFSEGSTQNVSSLLTAGRDPFYSAASYNFSAARFKMRGYDADYSAVYMNGIPMDNVDNGFTPFGLWGGLNDVMRNRDISQGLRYNTFAFGEIAGTTNIDTRASKQRKQTSFSYAVSNRNYTNRWMFTHSTGISKKGWAFTVSASRRWADEGYVPGTYYNGWSGFAGIDKKIGQKNLLSLVAFEAYAENGRQGAAVAEIMDLANTHYYNPYWGYQNGKKRNASIAKTNQPVFILTHEYHISNKASLTTAIGYSFGKRGITGLDWYNAPDPRPDYYRYLPSYTTNEQQKELIEDEFRTDENVRQINWQNLYDVNRSSWQTIHDANGLEGNDVSGNRSRYVITERVNDVRKLNVNTVFNTRAGEHVDLTAGISFQSQKNNYYQKLNDLLGGEFYIDLNQFAERDFPDNNDVIQNDLNRPNRILHAGDKYGYDYVLDEKKVSEWFQTVVRFTKFDFFAAGEVSYTAFSRKGNVRNGLFPDNSLGTSTLNQFLNYAVKAGITYKINGRNYIYVNAAYLTRAPYFENVYVSPRTRDVEQDDIKSEVIKTTEAAYILNAPKLKIHLSGYYTKFENGMNVLSFYHDQYRSFVNYALSNINKVHFGSELGFEAKVVRNVTVNGAAAVGRYYYDSRQNAVVTSDNTSSILDREIIYETNYRVPSTPQEAYSFGITYRSPRYWFLSLTANRFDQMWLDFNPIRRTSAAVEDVESKSDVWNSILQQTKLDAQSTLDFYGGYSWRLPKSFGFKKPAYFVINIGISNLLNNRNIISGGYEQLRFDYTERDVNKFPPKFFYAYGLNYFINATLRF